MLQGAASFTLSITRSRKYGYIDADMHEWYHAFTIDIPVRCVFCIVPVATALKCVANYMPYDPPRGHWLVVAGILLKCMVNYAIRSGGAG